MVSCTAADRGGSGKGAANGHDRQRGAPASRRAQLKRDDSRGAAETSERLGLGLIGRGLAAYGGQCKCKRRCKCKCKSYAVRCCALLRRCGERVASMHCREL